MPLAITATSTEFITLDEVKRHANLSLSGAANDLELSLIKGAAEEHVQSLIGAVLHRSVTETVRAVDGRVLFNQAPVLSVQSLTLSGQAVAYTLDSSGMLSGVRAYGDLTATYTVGRASAPDAVRLAALIIAEHLWQTQRGNAPSALPATDTGFAEPTFGVGFAIPNRALELLGPYLLPPGIA